MIRASHFFPAISQEVVHIILEKILKRINTICGYIGGVFIMISAVIMLYDVVSRYFFNSPSVIAPPVVSFFILGAVFLGVGYSFQIGSQVNIDLIIDKMPPLPRKICLTLGHCIADFFVFILMRESFRLAQRAFASKWVTFGNVRIPSGILYAVMVFGCVFLFLAVALTLVRIWVNKAGVNE